MQGVPADDWQVMSAAGVPREQRQQARGSHLSGKPDKYVRLAKEGAE